MNPERRVHVCVCMRARLWGAYTEGWGEHSTGHHMSGSLQELLTLLVVKQPPTSLMSCRVAACTALAVPEVRAGTKDDPGAVAQCYGVRTGSNRNQYTSWLLQHLPEASWLSL